jgi:hypothetical protein
MRTVQVTAVVLVSMGMFLGLISPSAEAENRIIRLNGFDEVPVVITNATGELRVRIDEGNQTIGYTLIYERIEGGPVRQAHIHLGQVHTTGPIVLFLCTNLGNAPAPPAPPTPACPVGPDGTVTGVLTAASVIAQPAQGVNTLEDVIQAMRNGVAYANVHTATSPMGEIRTNFHGKH